MEKIQHSKQTIYEVTLRLNQKELSELQRAFTVIGRSNSIDDVQWATIHKLDKMFRDMERD
jgi:hypothetical protein